MIDLLIIGLDFDGTMVEHDFPRIGPAVPHAVRVVRRLHDIGHSMVLHTCRSNYHLLDAVEWYRNTVKRRLHGFNSNQLTDGFVGVHKLYADLYIDDRGLGCPTISRPPKTDYVDWLQVEKILELKKVLPRQT